MDMKIIKNSFILIITVIGTIFAQHDTGKVPPVFPRHSREDSIQRCMEWMQSVRDNKRGEDHPKDSTSGRVLSIYFANQSRGKDPFNTEIHKIALVNLLKDPYACVRAAAIEALGFFPPTSSSVTAIRSLLSDGSLGVRFKAAEALMHLGASDSVSSRIILDMAKGKEIDHWSITGFYPVISPSDTNAHEMKIKRGNWQWSAIGYLKYVTPDFQEEAGETLRSLQRSSDTLISSQATREFRDFWLRVTRADDKPGRAPIEKETVPPEVQRIIEETMKGKHGLLNNFDGNKISMGFDSSTKLSDLKAGEPVKVYKIFRTSLEKSDENIQISAIARRIDVWEVPVLIKDTCVTTFEVEKGVFNHRWGAGVFNGRRKGQRYDEWQKVMEAWPKAKGYNPVIVYYGAWKTFFHVPEKDDANLTPLMRQPYDVLSKKADTSYTVLMPSKIALQYLLPPRKNGELK